MNFREDRADRPRRRRHPRTRDAPDPPHSPSRLRPRVGASLSGHARVAIYARARRAERKDKRNRLVSGNRSALPRRAAAEGERRPRVCHTGRRQETLAAVNNPIKSGRKRRPATPPACARLPASAIAAISSLLRYNAITLAHRGVDGD